jgi:DNA-binding MarR family transcriptional regulator
MPAKFVHPVQRATHRIGIYLSSLPGNELTQGEAHILALLARSRRASIAELHHGLAHKRSTLTSILDRLTGRGLIERVVGESDRRTFVITLTRKGVKLADRLYRHLLELERRVTRRVSAIDRRGFSKVVATLAEEAARDPRPNRRGRVDKKKREWYRPRI